MKIYTLETERGFFELHDFRKAKKKALEIAKEINEVVLITCLHKPSYKQDWFTVFPSGKITIDKTNFKANN